MTSTRFYTASSGVSRRFNDFWRRFFAPGDALIVVVTIALLLMPALSLWAAEWPLTLETVIPVLIISVLLGYYLARTNYNELLALTVSGLYGAFSIFLIAAINEPGGLLDGSASVIERLAQWLVDAATGGINQDELVFTLLVATLFWYLGYNAVWHIVRIDRVWRVILPPALIMLTNMVVYAGNASLEIYLIIFAFMALVLIAHSNLENLRWNWYHNDVRVPMEMHNPLLRAAAVVALIVVVGAWVIPMGDIQDRLNNFRQFLQSEPLQQMAEFWNRLVAPIESEGPATADYYGGDSLNLGGAIQLGDQIIFLVDAPQQNRYYWRSRVFERYDAGHWSPSSTLRVPDFNEPLDIIMDDEVIGSLDARQAVQQTITVGEGGTRLLYAAPQPLSFDVPGRIDLMRTQPLLYENSPMNISVVRPARVIERGMSYNATSLLSTASAHALRQAGTTYPDWVINPNASPGMSVSYRVPDLATSIVNNAGATNPYDKAKAIEAYLRTTIDYNERIPMPPDGADPVEWFLFDIREGYCTYYATAMVTMLRSLNIPARMAAGFSQGEWDSQLGQYVVRERDAHTWVEVYFPGYGWVEFEPTAAEAPINREGDDPVQPPVDEPQIQPPTPLPTATFTPVPSPTPLPSPTTPPDQPDDPNNDSQSQPPTITPTPSPTATATAVIVPTVPPPITPPPPDDFLSFLLPAAGAIALIFGLFILLLLVLLFIYWWWEWRGMGKFTPVARAFARLERYLGLIGIRTADEQTPEEKREYIVSRLPKAERPVTAIARAYMHERYRKPTDGSPEAANNRAEAERAWPFARGSILRRWIRKFVPFLRD